MKDRMISLLLGAVLIVGSFFSRVNMLPARAVGATSAIYLGSEAASEILLALYSVLDVSSVAGGARKGLGGSEVGLDVLNVFGDSVLDSSTDSSINLFDGMNFRFNDGSAVTFSDGLAAIRLLNGVVKTTTQYNFFKTLTLGEDDTTGEEWVIDTDGDEVPDTDADLDNYINMRQAHLQEKFEVFYENYNSGGTEPSPSPDPEKKPFSLLKSLLVGGTFLGVVGSFLDSVFKDETETPSDMYPIDSKYFPSGQVPFYTSSTRGYYGISAFAVQKGSAFKRESSDYICVTSSSYGRPCLLVYEPYICFTCRSNKSWNFPMYVPGTNSSYNIGTDGLTTLVANVPIFYNKAAADAYLATGDLTGNAGQTIVNVPKLIQTLPSTLAPITNKNISPNSLPAVSHAVSTSVSALPEYIPLTDSETETDTYTETVTDSITETVVETEPDVPVPSPTPGTGTDDGTADGDYKTDLKMIFPFCLPFDLIHFLQALDAEAASPVFDVPIVIEPLNINMVYKLELSIFNDVMKIFRLGELGLFVLALIVGTRKMIRW